MTDPTRPIRVKAEQFDPDKQPWPEGVREDYDPQISRCWSFRPWKKLAPPFNSLVYPGDWIVTRPDGLVEVVPEKLLPIDYAPEAEKPWWRRIGW